MASNVSDRPVIGISCYVERARWGVWDRRAALLPAVYVEAVHRAGGVPVLLPVLPDGAGVALSAVHGLVLAGGPDLDPRGYGHAPHPELGTTRPERDDWEARLLRTALERDLPVLGVCRGAQVLSTAFGGTLDQHLPDTVEHRGHQPAPAEFGSTRVRLEPGSRIAEIFGDQVDVPCYHHQALARVADELAITGRAEDGTVEAVELPGRFALGVQWHPEEDPAHDELFAALVAAAEEVSA